LARPAGVGRTLVGVDRGMIDFVESVTRARSVEEVWSLLSERMLDFGFDRLIYGFTRYKTATGFGDLQDILLLSTQTPDYMAEFIGNGLYFHAPMVRWARENTGACSWRWMAENFDSFSPSERKVVEFNRRMGVTAGYSISFRESSARSKGAIALTARAGLSQNDVDAIWAASGREIMAMNDLAHLAMTALPQSRAPRALTARQREALQWVGDGKTTQDIAMLMGLTSATVEKHLRLAREALDAETTAQAVLKASMMHQFYVLEF